MIDFLHLLIPILCAAGGNILVHFLGTKYKNYNVYLFSFFVNFVGALFLLIYNLGFKNFTNNTFIFAGIYAVFLVAFTLSKTKALTSGPITITTIIGCSNFIPVTIFNAIYWEEKISILEIIGMVLMLGSIILINLKFNKNKKENTKIDWKWIVFTSVYFIFSAVIAIFFRFQQNSDAKNTNEMMILAFFFSSLVFALISLTLFIKNKKAKKLEKIEGDNLRLFLIIAVVFGILNILFNRINFYNSATIDSALLFPVFNGSIVIIATIAGIFIFKEKINLLQIIGVVLDLIAIVFSSEFFGLITF